MKVNIKMSSYIFIEVKKLAIDREEYGNKEGGENIDKNLALIQDDNEDNVSRKSCENSNKGGTLVPCS